MAAPFFIITPASAEEIIRDYDVTANVHKDGTVDILEKITVNAEGNQIRHGIYRDMPTEYKDHNGKSFHMPFEIRGIWRDGEKEPYHTTYLQNGKRIYIGSKNEDVSYGYHTYDIQYRVGRVIGFFPEGDEFYWNVTGNGWVFPIQKASMTVTFPDGVNILKTTGYTGPQGSRNGFYKGQIFGNHFNAVTTRPLGPYEGLTIAASVPPGTIQKETTWQQIKYFFGENAIWLIWLSFAFLSIIYLTLAWMKYGRDTKGTIIPRFDAPDKIGPDLLRYLYRQSYDIKTFTTLVVNAASHRKIDIEEDKRATTLILNDGSKAIAGNVPNMGILTAAFDGLGSIVLPKKGLFVPKVDEETGRNLWMAQQSHKRMIESTSAPYLDKNTKYVAFGLIIGILGAIWAAFLSVNDDDMFFLILGSVIFYTLIFKLFGKIMPQYTLQGQDVVDHAEGLKMYMKTAERERMNMLYPKDITPETFEKLLPYAIALDVEQEWCDYINALIRDGVVLPPDGWNRNGWGYYSPRYDAMNSGFAALSSAISSASTAPGGSSGFSGGGGSGGGGGGGGGGGW